ncbi:MAG: hypothetical protein CMK59_11065 [Proteobacteria bacterium]|nr:hypothetical protein [Pseudomonadota bacterium]
MVDLAGSYLVLESTNRCNLACAHCAVSEEAHPHHQTTGMLDICLVEDLLSDLCENQLSFDSLILFWLGEPTLHPQFLEIYQKALRAAVVGKVFSKIELHTNGIRFSEQKRKGLLNSATIPQVIHFSLDAARPSTYLKIKRRDRLEQAVSNAKTFILEKKALGARWPRPIIQFILGRNNQDEADLFLDEWRRFFYGHDLPVRFSVGAVPNGEEPVIFFRQLDAPTAKQQQLENECFRRFAEKHQLDLPKEQPLIVAENLQPCSGFWKSPTIDWQGNVTVCTRDNELKNAVGNLRETSFSKLWWSEDMMKRRAKVALGDYEDHSLCQTCFIPKSLNHTDISELEIQRAKEFFNIHINHSRGRNDSSEII